MRKIGYSMSEFATFVNVEDIQELMKGQHNRFMRRFGLEFAQTIDVTLHFESLYDATDFYNEIRFNVQYRKLYTVTMNPSTNNSVIVSGVQTLFDYFGTREPNLLTASRDLGLRFTIDFVQDFTGTTFKGEVLNGELLARQCIIEVSDILPELALGGLCQIATSFDEFDLLLTRIYTQEAVVIR